MRVFYPSAYSYLSQFVTHWQTRSELSVPRQNPAFVKLGSHAVDIWINEAIITNLSCHINKSDPLKPRQPSHELKSGSRLDSPCPCCHEPSSIQTCDRSRCRADRSTMLMASEFALIPFLKEVCSWIRMLLDSRDSIISRNSMTVLQGCGGERGVRAEYRGG